MPIPTRLSRKPHDVLGAEAAGDLMTWMDEVGSHRDDIRDAMRADLAELRQGVHAVEIRLGDRLRETESRLSLRLDALNSKISDGYANLMKWSFVFWVGAVLAIAVLARVLR